MAKEGDKITLRDNQTGEIHKGKYNYVYRTTRGVWVHTIAGREIVGMMNGDIGNCTLEDNCESGLFTLLNEEV